MEKHALFSNFEKKKSMGISKDIHVTILGCGWLGKIVGKYLIEQGYTVSGSYRRPESKNELEDLGINPFPYEFTVNTNIPSEIKNRTDLLIIMFPPSSVKNQEESYGTFLTAASTQFPAKTKVIFTCSSGVYPKEEGIYNESFDFGVSISENNLKEAEEMLRKKHSSNLTILRLAGLIGPKRHPIHSLKGREISHSGKASVNLIHSADICRAIELIVSKNAFGSVFNLVFGKHPEKREYYVRAANALGLDPPKFGDESSPNRMITGSLIENELGFRYAHSIDNFDEFAI